MKYILLSFFLISIFSSFSQDTVAVNSNVFTKGLFMGKGKYELKVFNNLYTETGPYNNKLHKRSSFLSSFIQVTIGSNKKINYGVDGIYRSSVNNDFPNSSPFKVFEFKEETYSQIIDSTIFTSEKSHGLSHLGGRVRLKLFKDYRFTVQQSVYLPLIQGGAYIVNSDLFFEYINKANTFMFFGDLGVWYPVSQTPFVYAKMFVGTLISKRVGAYVMLNLPYEVGGGIKFFVLPKLELELLYTKWLPIQAIVGDRNPATFNLGIRYTNFSNFGK